MAIMADCSLTVLLPCSTDVFLNGDYLLHKLSIMGECVCVCVLCYKDS